MGVGRPPPRRWLTRCGALHNRRHTMRCICLSLRRKRPHRKTTMMPSIWHSRRLSKIIPTVLCLRAQAPIFWSATFSRLWFMFANWTLWASHRISKSKTWLPSRTLQGPEGSSAGLQWTHGLCGRCFLLSWQVRLLWIIQFVTRMRNPSDRRNPCSIGLVLSAKIGRLWKVPHSRCTLRETHTWSCCQES